MSLLNTGRRASDQNGWRAFMCWFAQRASDAWDWVDKRDIDAQAVAIAILYITWHVTSWAMAFASSTARPGVDVALIIGAILGPWSLVQGASIKFILEHRRAP